MSCELKSAFFLELTLVKLLKAATLATKTLTVGILDADWHKTKFNLWAAQRKKKAKG